MRNTSRTTATNAGPAKPKPLYHLGFEFTDRPATQIISDVARTPSALGRLREKMGAKGVRVLQHLDEYEIERHPTHKMTHWEVVNLPAAYAEVYHVAARRCKHCGHDQFSAVTHGGAWAVDMETSPQLFVTCAAVGKPERTTLLSRFHSKRQLFKVNDRVWLGEVPQGRIMSLRIWVGSGRVQAKVEAGVVLDIEQLAIYKQYNKSKPPALDQAMHTAPPWKWQQEQIDYDRSILAIGKKVNDGLGTNEGT